jgi:hypothetical protein
LIDCGGIEAPTLFWLGPDSFGFYAEVVMTGAIIAQLTVLMADGKQVQL